MFKQPMNDGAFFSGDDANRNGVYALASVMFAKIQNSSQFLSGDVLNF